MLDFLALNADKAFLIVLVGVAIAAFIVSRMGDMPAKGWVFVAAAAASVVGWRILKSKRQTMIKNEIKRIEDNIEKRKPTLVKNKNNFDRAVAEFDKELGTLEAQKVELERQRLLIEAEAKAREKQILQMTPDQVREEAARIL